MNFRPKIPLKRFLIAAAIAVVGLPALFYGGLALSRPHRTPLQKQLFQGITYKREPRSAPRPLMIHVVTIDLTAPGIGALVTPGKRDWLEEYPARTTSEFLRQFNLQLAINGSFFYPFHEKGPFDYYPHSGDPVNLLGQGISNGVSYSPSKADWPVLCLAANNRAQIRQESCPKGTLHGLSGSDILVERGAIVPLPDRLNQDSKLHPRTAVATDERGEKMWLVVIDGRQPLYSEGVTLPELTDIVMELGAHTVLNLDGGGSTALVAAGFWGPHSLNAPIHTRIPMRQRPVANHLGFYARPAF
ncbi:phosphodiester glycosidase family protein [Kamptonema formosum]|uniref:phosphodiester glycosidase family protein n=1 Tax=Kamptonema formosum TaxID=331992 RepID=UPI00034C8863|nr:phosphodiester glycosidase family protein [Oscillatoria sp. PCC 10802]